VAGGFDRKQGNREDVSTEESRRDEPSDERYANEPAASVENVLRKWLPGTTSVHAAVDLIPLVLDRVRAGTRSWMQTGQLPTDVIALDPAVAQLQHAPPGSLQRMEGELGPGQPLDGNTAARMSSTLGADVSDARIHTGPTAQRMAAEHDALAFTVGQNIVMGAQAPTTGDHADALLAHELVHTLQQKDAASDAQAGRHGSAQ